MRRKDGAGAAAGRAVRWGLMAGGLACLGTFALVALWLRSTEPSLLTLAGAIFALPLVLAGLAMLALSLLGWAAAAVSRSRT